MFPCTNSSNTFCCKSYSFILMYLRKNMTHTELMISWRLLQRMRLDF